MHHRAGLPQLKLNEEISVQRVRGDLVDTVSQVLKANDLLVFIASTYGIGQPALGRESEAIARSHGKTSMIIVHFPTSGK
jgi:hypothetical protein